MIYTRVHGLASFRRKMIALSRAETVTAKTVVARTTLGILGTAKEETPVDTGRLRNSEAAEFSDSGFTGRVGTNLDYAPHVHFGTRYMAGRPFLFSAAEQWRDRFHRDMAVLIRDGAKRVL